MSVFSACPIFDDSLRYGRPVGYIQCSGCENQMSVSLTLLCYYVLEGCGQNIKVAYITAICQVVYHYFVIYLKVNIKLILLNVFKCFYILYQYINFN